LDGSAFYETILVLMDKIRDYPLKSAGENLRDTFEAIIEQRDWSKVINLF
jgi:hypothetical protein